MSARCLSMPLSRCVSAGFTFFTAFYLQTMATTPALAGSAVKIAGDVNRDGVIDARDEGQNQESWTWASGTLVMPNLDDDDRDGKSDALDTRVNGIQDDRDLARLEIDPGQAAQVVIDWGTAPIHAFVRNEAGGSWDFVAPGKAIASVPDADGKIVLGVESYKLVGQDQWDGKASIRVTAYDARGQMQSSDDIVVRATSWIMLPNSAATQTFYFATGFYRNEAMLKQLQSIIPSLGAELLRPHAARSWQEMWMQDSLEMGYLEIPGARMHMVLNGVRNHDSFGPTLLGPDVGVFQIGKFRDLGTSGPDSWVDWFGNLEVSHPTAEFPLGRVYYGMNTATGKHVQDAIIKFIAAQEVQAPFWVDTSWLIIKHVDEIFNFVPGPDGKGVLYVVSPRAAAEAMGKPLDPANAAIQKLLDKMLIGGTYQVAGQGAVNSPGVLRELGWDPQRVVHLPLLFSAAANAHNEWSNPVNSVYVNGDVVTGSSYVPALIRTRIEEIFRANGVRKVHFVDDKPYQDNLGNVHCSSNTRKLPVVTSYWETMAR